METTFDGRRVIVWRQDVSGKDTSKVGWEEKCWSGETWREERRRKKRSSHPNLSFNKASTESRHCGNHSVECTHTSCTEDT